MCIFKKFEELSVKASQLPSCFYCSGSLPASKQEHIFNDSWGGTHKTGQLICDDCNQSFSVKVDKAFSIYTDMVMNAWSFKGKRRKSIPTIELEGSYFLDAGAKLKLKKPLIEEEIQADGTIRPRISFNSRGEGKRWLGGAGAESWLKRSLSKEERDYLSEQIRQAKFRSEDAQPQEVSVTLDLRSQYRSAAHTILKCLGFFMPDWVGRDQTKQVREFARYDRGDWRRFAVEIEQHFSVADEAVRELGLGVKHNSVEIYWCSYLKMVIGVLTILNRVKRAVVIAKDYSGPDKVLYVFEDTHGSGKPPRAISVEINSQKCSLPIVGIQYFADPARIYQVFHDELLGLGTTYYPIDALTDKLIKTIESINQESVEIDDKLVDKYQQACLEFFTNLGKIVGKSIELDRLRAKVSDLFAGLTNRFSGRNCNDSEFTSCVAEIFDNIKKEFE